MGGISSPIASLVADVVAAPIYRHRHAEKITGPPAKVSGVSPVNGAINQQLDIYLSWVKPAMAQRYDVYFGDSAETLALVSSDQSARVKELPGLSLDSTYYFRIDAVNDLGTTAGDVCSFSTWATADIETDELGNPLTDETGRYLETSTGWVDKDSWLDRLFWRN